MPEPRDWVVWSYEHDSWWASKRAGYVGSLLLAGLYTEAEAKEIERNANHDRRKMSEEARSLTQALIDERAGWGRRDGMVIDVVESALSARLTDDEFAHLHAAAASVDGEWGAGQGDDPLAIALVGLATRLRPDLPVPAGAPELEPAWGEDPEATQTMLLLVGGCLPDPCALWRHDANELLAVVRVWTREQREAAERWAGAVHVHASDHDDVEVPAEPPHVTALRRASL